jgi:hypothetical protein
MILLVKHYRKNIISQLEDKPYFTKNTFFDLAKIFGVKETTINSYITKSIANKEIVPLMRGVYVTRLFYEKNKHDRSYLFYLANVLRGPSYVSSWSALQYYNLTTEIINIVTSVTIKVTRQFDTKLGTFSYQSMCKDFFRDFVFYKSESHQRDNPGDEKFEFFIAEPSKALFDLIYLKSNQLKGMSIDDVILMVKGLRIDIDEMDKIEKDKFFEMVNMCIVKNNK